MHVLRGIHIYKCRLVLRCGLATGAHLRKARTGTLLGTKTQRQLVSKVNSVSTQQGLYICTFDRRSSVKTLQTSLCLTTIQGWLPSQSSTFDTGSFARSLAYSNGGSAATGLAKGYFGASSARLIDVLLERFCEKPYQWWRTLCSRAIVKEKE